MQRKREIQDKKHKEWEQRKKQREWENEQFNDYFWVQNFYSFLFSHVKNQKPNECFEILGLSANANEVEVKSAYKKLAILHHPDKGGKQEMFVQITESKNKCLNWLSSEGVS